MQVLRLRSVVELAGMLARDGYAPVSLSEMDQAIVQGAIDSGKQTNSGPQDFRLFVRPEVS